MRGLKQAFSAAVIWFLKVNTWCLAAHHLRFALKTMHTWGTWHFLLDGR